MSWLVAAQLAVLGIRWAYHRWFEDKDSPAPQDEIQIPLTQEGAAYPLIYGRCRVREPILAWAGDIDAEANPDDGGLDSQTYWQGAPFLYYGTFLFNIGIGFQIYDGVQPANYVYGIYAGDERISDGPHALLTSPGAPYVRLSELVGNGDNESAVSTGPRPCFVTTLYNQGNDKGSEFYIGGLVEFYNGRSDQTLVNGSGTPTTAAADRMVDEGVSASLIPGYRGMLSIFLGGESGSAPGIESTKWALGSSGRMHAMGFEAGSYPVASFGSPTIGSEANPVDVLYDLLTGTRGKLGLPASLIDTTSFQAAANTIYAEGDGYSRSVPAGRARDMISELLLQMDAVLYPDHDARKFKLKLIRPDYVYSDLLIITPDTAESLEFVESYGWTGQPRKFRLVFSNRLKEYDDDSVIATNDGNAFAQIEAAEEFQIRMPGICTATNARAHLSREASARARPLKKLKAICSRAFRVLNPGDAVRVGWPEYNLTGVFRVATPSRRGATDNTVELDLIEDHFYTHRFEVTDTGGLPTPPSGAVE